MIFLLHFKKKTLMWKLDSPSFVIFALYGVSLQVHKEQTRYVSVLLVKTPFCYRRSKLVSHIQDLVNKVLCDPSNRECMMHRWTNCSGTNALRKFLEEELSDIDPDFQFHYSQWQTTDRASLVTVTSTCEEYKDTLISAINAITKLSL